MAAIAAFCTRRSGSNIIFNLIINTSIFRAVKPTILIIIRATLIGMIDFNLSQIAWFGRYVTRHRFLNR